MSYTIEQTDFGYRATLLGQRYIDFMRRYHALVKPRGYFEIGVHRGISFSLASCPSVGVDPNFSLSAPVIGGKTAALFYQCTSDDFFARYELNKLLPDGIDLMFLDGMHQFEFLLRDFFNAERYANERTVIFLHDCIPMNAEMAERDRRPDLRKDVSLKSYWTGDVYKVVDILKTFRPDLKITALNCAPTGLIAVSKLDPKSNILSSNYDSIIDDYMSRELTDQELPSLYERANVDDCEFYLEKVGSGRPGSLV